MAYATQQDMIDSFGNSEIVELTNLEDPAAVAINPVPLVQALDDSTNLIDGYLASRYTLPLPSPIPAVLVGVCCDIARYRLDKNRAREDVRKRFEDAIAWLKDLARGLVSLGIATNDQPATELGGVAYLAPDRIFTTASLGGF